MGSGASKTAASAAKTSVKATPRKYPTRAPPASPNRTNAPPTQPHAQERVGPNLHPEKTNGAVELRDRGVELDASDPDLDFAHRLNQLGPVQPHPTHSNSSTFNQSSPSTHQTSSSATSSQFQPSASTPSQSIYPDAKQNPAVSLLTARYRLAEEAEQEFSNIGRKGSEGRQFLDVITIRQVLLLRDERGVSPGEIEKQLGLRRGVVGRLGRRGVVTTSEAGGIME